ncbi:hypothetical protein LINGRAHAP2_LOCUS2125 [Linum grandiflorum]
MKLGSWNIGGLGHPSVLQVLRDLVDTHKPKVVTLLETLTNNVRMEEVRMELGFAACFTVDAIGHSWGLAPLP